MRYSDRIGKQIRSIREAKGYSQEYMAEMLDTCQSAYANLESGKSMMSVDRLLTICEILNMDVHRLLDLAEKSTVTSPQDTEWNTSAHAEIHPEIKFVYDQLIIELRGEIEFLRGLVRQQGERM